MSLPCKTKLFKFLLISIFLLISTICCDSLMRTEAKQMSLEKPCPANKVQAQQRTIISHLERLETKFSNRDQNNIGD